MSSLRFWSTEKEIEYINKIGTYHPEYNCKAVDYLAGYIRALEKRVAWNGMDKFAVMSHAHNLLSTYESI